MSTSILHYSLPILYHNPIQPSSSSSTQHSVPFVLLTHRRICIKLTTSHLSQRYTYTYYLYSCTTTVVVGLLRSLWKITLPDSEKLYFLVTLRYLYSFYLVLIIFPSISTENNFSQKDYHGNPERPSQTLHFWHCRSELHAQGCLMGTISIPTWDSKVFSLFLIPNTNFHITRDVFSIYLPTKSTTLNLV